MDNKESVIKSIVEESNNTIKSTVFRGRSSSILKQPNVQNEAKNNPSTRRVSFSSNYIKTFTTDTEKNTIWDTTVEELLSAAESSNSREGHDLNTTLFNGKGNESEQGESESSEDDFSRDRASTKNSADISLMEFTCVNSTLHSNVAKPDDPTNTSGSSPDNSVTMDFTCVDPSFHSKSGNQSTCSQSTNTEDSSVSMEFTCVNPTFPLKSGNQSTTTEDSSISMEFTCVNPTFHSKPGNQSTYSQSTITKDSSVSMELTCVNPIFHSNTKQKPADTSESVNTSHTAKIQDLGNTSVSMEFTCVNPIFHLNNEKKQADTSESFNAPHTAKIHNPENTSVPMELTCVNPTFHSSTKKDQVDTFNASRTAEIQNPGDTSLSMEFTCVNPTLPLNTKQATGLFNTPHTDKIQNPENTSVSMEFTCVNPTLHLNTKKTAESFNAPHTAKIQNPGNTSVSMEFTCVNPTLHSNTKKTSESFNASHTAKIPNPGNNTVPMELTCVNPAFNLSTKKQQADISESFNALHTAKIQNPRNTSVSMEFTCVNPTLHSNTKKTSESFNASQTAKIPNPGNTTVPMELTCVNPTLHLNPKKTQADISESFNASHKDKIQNPVNTSVSMEFTCVNPTLHSNPKKTQADTSESFNASHTAKIPNPGNTTVPMEFTCVNPTLHSNPKKTQADTSESFNASHKAKIPNPGNTTVPMEFTCVNPILHSNPKKTQADTSESFNASHKAKIQNPVNTSVSMEFTCVNPTLHSNPKKTQADTSESFNASHTAKIPNPGNTTVPMEFTCVNPTLHSNPKKTQADTSESFNASHKAKIPNPGNTTVPMEFTCVNPTLHSNPKKTQADTSESFNASHTAKIQNPGNTSVPMEFTCVNPTLHSNCNDGKGANIPLKKSPNKFESYALADKSNTAEFLLRNYQDKTNLSNFSMLDCSKGISLMASVAQTSTQASFNVSPQIDKDQTVDMPSMSLPDITLSSIQPAPTLPVSIGNLQIENGTTKLNQAVDLASSDSEIDKSIAQMNDFSKEESSDLESILQTQSSKSSTLDLLCKSNIDFSAMSTVDDTLQLLRDASQLNRTKTALNNTSGTQLNKTYLVEDSRLEDTKDSTFQDNNSDMHETHPEDHIDLFSKCAEISGNNYILDRNTIELIENSTDGSLLSASDNSKEQEDKIDDFKEVTTPKSVSDNNAVHSAISGSEYMVQSPESDRLTVVTSKKGEPKTTEEILRGDFSAADFLIVRQRDMLILKEKLQSIVIDSSLPVDDWKKHIPTLEKLKEQSLRNRKIIAEKYDKFKKQLKDAIETCEKNKFVPEKLPEDDDVIESDELENILPAKRGIVEKIEEKSKICDNSWKMIKMEDGIAVFTSFFDQMKITVEYCQSDYRVSGIETKSLLTDKAKPAGILIQREFLRLLSPTLINNSIGRQYNILSLLDYIQMTMDKIRKCYKTFKDLVATHDMQISKDFKVKFFLLDEYSIIKWDFCIDLSDLDKITKESISVSASIGKVNAKHVLDLVSQCPKGLGFLESFIMKVEEYLETLRKRKRMLKLRKIQRVCEE